jgi:secondary thiamine-phosphate synthase enzyme
MKIVHHGIALATTEPIQVIDITARVQAVLETTGIREGLLTLISPHTTARVNLNECEEMLQRDMVAFLERLAPRDGGYLHNRKPVDGRRNAHSHLLGLFMNASETIPIADGRLLLGGWQSIFLCELDGPRAERQIHLHFLGHSGIWRRSMPTRTRTRTSAPHEAL